ncbi:unnamed protein product [Clonostachys rosea f. rosea IK726]|uniref:Uncharacterized protein n=1 Tax=Clonostachys rosea f. rosea IK726 TaxID=1349383 RepID=A0ACA9U8P9_BIOOC|nr:unnamed protein product [Clonostachys rosea f. rosea IK726]
MLDHCTLHRYIQNPFHRIMEPPKFRDQALVMLTVTNDTHDPHFPYRSLTLSGDQATTPIGRQSSRRRGLEAASNNFLFDCPVMSRDHATIKLDNDKQEVSIKDAGSLHGTFVNSLRLRDQESKRLLTGDVITFGVNIDRGAEKFRPFEVEATIAFGTDERNDLPTVFRVPDDTDVEEMSGSEGENGTGYAQKVLRENQIRPAPQLPPLSTLDLTPVVDVESYKNGESVLLPIDLTSNASEIYEISDPTPSEIPATTSFSTENNLDGEEYMAWDDESHNSEIDEEFPYESESDSYSSEIESPRADGNEEYNTHTPEQGAFFSDEELTSEDGDGLEEHGETTLPDDNTTIPDPTVTVPVTLMDSMPLPEISPRESEELPPNALRSVHEVDRLTAVPLNLMLTQEQTPGKLEYSQDESLSFVSSQQPSPPDLVSQGCGDQVIGIFGQNSDKADFFNAREENKKRFAAELGPQHEQTPMDAPTLPTTSKASGEKEALSLSSILNDECSQETWEQFSPLEVSGRNFLNTPLTTDEPPVSSDPCVLDDTSAYTFEISKKVEQSQTEPVEKQDEEVVGDKIPESPNPLKRKAAQISQTTVKELTDDFRAALKAQEAAHSPKRLRRAAEVVGYVALGGIAVMSALIVTAPAL